MRFFATKLHHCLDYFMLLLLVHQTISLDQFQSCFLSSFAKRLHHLVVLLSVILSLVHQVILGTNHMCRLTYLWLPTFVTLSVLILVCLGSVSHASDSCILCHYFYLS